MLEGQGGLGEDYGLRERGMQGMGLIGVGVGSRVVYRVGELLWYTAHS